MHHVLLALLLLLIPLVAQAAGPTWRWIGTDEGLDPRDVQSLVQSADHRILIGGPGGVFRWDGTRVQRVDAGRLRLVVHRLVALPDGRVVAKVESGDLWWIDEELTRLVKGLDDQPGGFSDISLDADGRLVALHRTGLFALEGDDWVELSDHPSVRSAIRVAPGPGRSILIGGFKGWFRWRDGKLRPFLPGKISYPYQALLAPDDTVWMLNGEREILHLSADGELLEAWPTSTVGTKLVLRGREVWWASGTELLRIRPGHQPNTSHFEVPSSGPLLVDHEGSLWLGNGHGLGRLSEPDAQALTSTPEIGNLSGRSVAISPDSAWLGTWSSPVHYDRLTGQVSKLGGPLVNSTVCLDADHVAWGVSAWQTDDSGFVAMGGSPPGVLGYWPEPQVTFWADCWTASDGSVLLATAGWLWRARGLEKPVKLTPLPLNRPGRFVMVVRVYAGSVWVGSLTELCSASEAEVSAGAPRWTCYELPKGRLRDVVVTDAGGVWAAGADMGVLRLSHGVFEPHPGAEDLPTRSVHALRSSLSGGVWVLAPSVIIRVMDRPELVRGWSVQERLNERIGALVNAPGAVVEDVEGTLWFAAFSGLVSVPRGARSVISTPPSVLLVEVGVDGQSMPLADLHLPRSDSHLRLRFVSPSFKAQRLVRFRMRLDDRPYSDPSDIAQFGFTQMGPGEHTISVSATLDGESWSEVPAVVHVTVPRHWVGRWETWLAIVGGAAALVFGALVVRQRAHLGLETLRTRIALDLHDEVGAGLASVGLLGGLLRDDLPSDVHDQLVDRIVGTSKDLGGALRAIVWSLQPSSLNMGSLGVYLEDRARGVFGDFDLQHTLFISRPPDDASTRLGLDVLRAVQLVTLEALHNAARHARATQVELRLESCGRDRWRVVVQDNGVGVRPRQTSTVDSGNGLESMARRAREIGGELVVGPGVHGGTRVQLEFSPTARRRRRA